MVQLRKCTSKMFTSQENVIFTMTKFVVTAESTLTLTVSIVGGATTAVTLIHFKGEAILTLTLFVL